MVELKGKPQPIYIPCYVCERVYVCESCKRTKLIHLERKKAIETILVVALWRFYPVWIANNFLFLFWMHKQCVHVITIQSLIFLWIFQQHAHTDGHFRLIFICLLIVNEAHWYQLLANKNGNMYPCYNMGINIFMYVWSLVAPTRIVWHRSICIIFRRIHAFSIKGTKIEIFSLSDFLPRVYVH